MKLADCMRDRGVNQEALAAVIHVSQPTVSKIIERGRASARVALAIERWSGGQVPAETLNDEVALVRRNMRAA